MAQASKGPLIVFGSRNTPGAGAAGSENADLAPSLIFGGVGVYDPRGGYNNTRAGALGFGATGESAVIKQAPAALSAANIAAAQVPNGGVALNLAAASGAGVTVVGTPTRISPSGNLVPAGALAIDGIPNVMGFGRQTSARSGNTEIGVYDPTTFLARNVRITSVGNDTGGSFLVSGADVYGYPMTEQITGANAGVAAGRKAFKFIFSIVGSNGLSGSNVSVGTGDVYGLPFRADSPGEVWINWAGSWLLTPTIVPADQTSPATSTTGDPRGTFTPPSASNGTNLLLLYCMPSVSNTGSLFGVTPA